MSEGFLHLLGQAAAAEPGRVFARTAEASLTLAALDARSDAMAAALVARGLVPGDRVAAVLPNELDSLALAFGLAKAGLVWVPLNPALVGDGLRHLLDLTRARLVLAQGAASLGAVPPAGFATRIPDPAADFAIGTTSGTTGPPKGVRISHRMLRLAGEGVALAAAAHDGDVMFLWEPLHHIGGVQMLVLPLLRRAVLHLVPRFSASRFWAEVAAAGATHLHYLGGILQILLKQDPHPRERAHALRIAWGAGCPAELWPQVQDRFGVALRECYGMTEASSFSTFNADGVPGSVGRAMPWFDIAILDPGGRALPPGERGEIVVRAKDPLALTRGYLDNPEATARALRGGALHSGDSGSLDAAGNLFFHGRMTDSVRVRGENVSAWEVEAVAAQHPAVADCAMIGVAAEIGEQEIKLFLQPRRGMALDLPAFHAWLAPRLARHQLPRYLALVEDFARTPSQRIRKFALPRTTADGFDAARPAGDYTGAGSPPCAADQAKGSAR
ncbi:AMP-binding protein [Falsiroseomonas selenitidurans]|uniref:ATP-dependent acyl-CoA ligase n=1 Tax=Falsiroseomonas selenitidurans TaxID=2716335 RepID=A0ABX1DYB9_9PROT|nr:AMP-binding protein [Falsiroseomonas selenitidurans]NKC29876.1 ATP-dependent acyl-CoA ligase [Falsiroseomonas selenitidurans]